MAFVKLFPTHGPVEMMRKETRVTATCPSWPSGLHTWSLVLTCAARPAFCNCEPLMGEDWLTWAAWPSWPALPRYSWVGVYINTPSRQQEVSGALLDLPLDLQGCHLLRKGMWCPCLLSEASPGRSKDARKKAVATVEGATQGKWQLPEEHPGQDNPAWSAGTNSARELSLVWLPTLSSTLSKVFPHISTS